MKRIAWTILAVAAITCAGPSLSFAHDGPDHGGRGDPRGRIDRDGRHDHDRGSRDGSFGFGFGPGGFGFGLERGGFGFRFERDFDRGGGSCRDSDFGRGGPSYPDRFAPRPFDWRW